MFLLQSKSVHFFVTLVFVGAMLCVSCAEGENAVKKGAEGEDAVKKDVKDMDSKDSPQQDVKDMDSKDTPKQDVKDMDSKDSPQQDVKDMDSKDIPQQDVKDTDSKDTPQQDVKDMDSKDTPKQDDKDNSTKQDAKPEDSKDRPKTRLEEEAEYIFLTAEEANDFLGIGPMFEDPEHHKFLMEDYMMMEHSDYWELRCDEIVAQNNKTNESLASFKKPAYCA